MNASQAQSGFVLLLLLLVVVAVGISLFLSVPSTAEFRLKRQQQGYQSLETAKDFLLARALMGDRELDGDIANDQPGSLSCPDVDNDGQSDVTGSECSVPIEGRFPYRTYGSALLVDQDGEPIWFVLSQEFRAGNSDINDSTVGDLELDGVAGYAALLIQPGKALSGQAAQRSADENDSSGYLEGENVDGDNAYENQTESDAFNDVVIGISTTELMERVLQRVMQEASDNAWCSAPPAATHYFCDNDWDVYACGSDIVGCP